MNKQIILSAIVAIALLSCSKAQNGGGNASQNQVMTVSTSDCEVEDNYFASIQGKQDIAIFPQVGGFITDLKVKEGQRVKKGQILFVIDQVAFKAALETAQANIEVANASVATAELTYNSKKQLYQDKVISQYDLQMAENQYLTAKAGLAQAKANLVNAQNNLNYTEVKAPCDGVVGTLPYREGTLVSPQMPQPLTTVSDNSTMYVYFSMTENQYLALVKKYGSREKILEEMPAVSLVLNNGERYSEQGRIETISGVIDPQTGTFSLRAAFPNKDGILASGGAGQIILTSVHPNAIVIPRTATYEVQDKTFVYKVVEGKAVSTMITVERIAGGKNYIVYSGLEAGDVIVTDGVAMLHDGAEISAAAPAEEAPAEEAPADTTTADTTK